MKIDLRGLKCPLVVISAKRAIKKNPQETAFEIHTDDESASTDVPAMANTLGMSCESRSGSFILRRK